MTYRSQIIPKAAKAHSGNIEPVFIQVEGNTYRHAEIFTDLDDCAEEAAATSTHKYTVHIEPSDELVQVKATDLARLVAAARIQAAQASDPHFLEAAINGALNAPHASHLVQILDLTAHGETVMQESNERWADCDRKLNAAEVL